MYFYLYDAALAEPKHSRTLADIETRLTDLGLQGRIGRLSPLKSPRELITSALRAGAKTIVAVGNDQTVAAAINAMVGANVALGVIPIDKPNTIAKLLGIPNGTGAVAVLAARKIEVVDLGKINNYYFLTSARASGDNPLTLQCEDRYTLQPLEPRSALIFNNLESGAHCQDGYLEATVESGTAGWWRRKRRSVVPLRRGTLSATGPGTIVAENVYTVKLPATIEVVPQTLRIIVGRDRVF